MNIIENHLCNKMTPMEFKYRRNIASGSYGRVIEAVHNPTAQPFALKFMDITEEIPEELIRKEINFLNSLETLTQKPSLFPRFYGYFLSSDETFGKNTFALLFDLKKQNLNDIIAEKKGEISLNTFISCLMQLVHGLAYLQTLKICHRDIKPQNILCEIKQQNPLEIELTLIDFGVSKDINNQGMSDATQEMTVIGTENYFSPELRGTSEDKTLINPYKSDVFSLGLVMVKLALAKLPRASHLEYDVLKFVKEIKDNFLARTEKTPENCRLIENSLQILADMLIIDRNARPDFIELFLRTLRIESRSEEIQKLILLRDRGFVEKTRNTLQISENFPNKNQNEESKEAINQHKINSSQLIKKISETFHSEIPQISLVISGNFFDRVDFLNKIVSSYGVEKPSLFEIPSNFIEMETLLIEIENKQSYEIENKLDLVVVTRANCENKADFAQKLKEIFSDNSICYLKSKEKPFIYQKLNIPLKNCPFKIFLAPDSFADIRVRDFLKKRLDKSPSLFMKLKPIDNNNKYDFNYLCFFRKYQRKNLAEFWSIFLRESEYIQRFSFEEKDNEQTLINKKYQKVNEFEKIMSYEESVLSCLPCRKRIFFLDFNEKETINKIFSSIASFSDVVFCEKALLSQIKTNKKLITFDTTLQISQEKLQILKENTDFFLSSFSDQIEIFFEKLHQGSVNDMRKNLDYFSKLDKIIANGVNLLKITENFYSKKAFVKQVFELIGGDLQDFFRKKIFELMYPFLDILLKESINNVGIDKIQSFFQWKLADEEIQDLEKLLLAILLRNQGEFIGKIKEKLVLYKENKPIECLKLLRFSERSFQQISSNIGFWSYDGTKNDIVEMVLISLRENKVKNIEITNRILQEISNEFIEKIAKGVIKESSFNGEKFKIQREIIEFLAETAANSEINELFTMNNKSELKDESLREFLQVKLKKN